MWFMHAHTNTLKVLNKLRKTPQNSNTFLTHLLARCARLTQLALMLWILYTAHVLPVGPGCVLAVAEWVTPALSSLFCLSHSSLFLCGVEICTFPFPDLSASCSKKKSLSYLFWPFFFLVPVQFFVCLLLLNYCFMAHYILYICCWVYWLSQAMAKQSIESLESLHISRSN